MFSFTVSMGGSTGVTSVVETTALRKRRKRRSKHKIIKYRRENNLPLSLSQEKYRKRQNRRARERWRKKKRAERSSRNDSSMEPSHQAGSVVAELPGLLPREDDDSDGDCSDDESDDDEGDDVAVGDLSVSSCDVANASSSTLSNTEHFDPSDLPDFRDKDPSEAADMIKQLMDLEKKLLTNCSTAAGHNSGDVKGDDSISSRQDYLFQVFVRTPYGNTITLSVNQSTTVTDLKRQLSSSTTITPSNEMRLCYGGKPLNGSLTLAEYGITRNSTLEMHDGGLMGGSWGESECPGESAVYS